MTDLHELYDTLLPQHDLDAMKAQGRTMISPKDRSHGNAGEVPAVAATHCQFPERCTCYCCRKVG